MTTTLPELSPPARRGALYVAQYRLRSMWKWRGTLVAFGIGTPVLYLASIGLGVGLLVDANSTGGVDGVPYLVFLAPALIAAAAIQGGTDDAMFPSLHGFLWSKLFFAMRATSLTGGQIAEGILLGAAFRVTVTSIAYWLVLWAFGAVGIGSALPLIVVSIFAGTAWAALILAIVAGVHDDSGFLSVVGRLVFMPMFLFSGTFYPLSSLPLAVQWIGWISPLWHATELGRWLSYGQPTPAWQLALSVAYLLTIGVGGILVARVRFERRLTS